jgi:catalase-peroxidase
MSGSSRRAPLGLTSGTQRRGRGAHDPRRPRPHEEAQTDDDHGGHVAEDGPDLRAHLPAFPPGSCKAFADAFARAWFKLTHRDMGPRARYLGPEVPAETLIWQDPVPAVDHPLIDAEDINSLKATIFSVRAHRGGAGRRRLGPRPLPSVAQTNGAAPTARGFAWPRSAEWEVNQPEQLNRVLGVLEGIQAAFNGAQQGGKRVSLADLIVLGGGVAVEEAVRRGGHAVTVPFSPGRTDASAEQTDAASFAVLEPIADGFRNYAKARVGAVAENLLVDRAQLLGLTAPEMTALVGGMRALGATVGGSTRGAC